MNSGDLSDCSNYEDGNAEHVEQPREKGASKRKRGPREAEIREGAQHTLTRADGSVACRFVVETAHVLQGGMECAQFRCVEKGCTDPLSHLIVPKTKGRGTFSRKTDSFKTHAALHITDCKTVKQKQEQHERSLGCAMHTVELFSFAFSRSGREAARIPHDDAARLDEWASRQLESHGSSAEAEPVLVLDAPPAAERTQSAMPHPEWKSAESTLLPADRREYAHVHGSLLFLHRQCRQLKLASPGVRAMTYCSVSKLIDSVEGQSLHPSLALPALITRVPSKIAEQARLSHTERQARSALLSLIGHDKMLPSRWQFVQNEHVWVLFMHTRSNLAPHVDYNATAVKYDHISGMKLVLAWPPTEANLQRLAAGASVEEFEHGVRHVLLPGQQVLIAPLVIHVFVNLSPCCSVGTNFECPVSTRMREWIESKRNAPWHEGVSRMLHT